MRPKKLAALLVLCALVSACGGGGGKNSDSPGDPPVGQDPPPPPPPAPPPSFDPSAATQLNIETRDDFRNVEEPVVLLDRQGNGLAAYLQINGQRLDVFARRFDAATQSFGEQRLLSGLEGGTTFGLSVRLDEGGRAMAIWLQEATPEFAKTAINVVAASYDPISREWSAPQKLTQHVQQPNRTEAQSPDVAIGPDGRAFAAWIERTGPFPYRYRLIGSRFDGQTWSAPETIRDADAPEALITSPRVAFSAGNVATVVSIEEPLDGQNNAKLFLRQQVKDGQWHAGVLDDSEDHVWTFDLAHSAGGDMVVVWQRKAPAPESAPLSIHARRGRSDGSWSAPIVVDDRTGEGLSGGLPAVGLDAQGRAWFAWSSSDAASGIYALRLNAAGNAFDAGPRLLEAPVGNSLGRPVMASDAKSNVLIAWRQLTNQIPASGGTIDVYSLFASRFDAETSTISAPALIESNEADPARLGAVALGPEGRGLAVWVQNEKVMANRFD
jgi:hypothetical protein